VAQTMAVTFVIMFQIFYMVHCRSLKDNLLTIGLFSNPMVFAGIGAILVLHLFFVYLPISQRIFGTTALGYDKFGLAAAAAFAIFPLISLEKWIRNRMHVE
jgi:Ca2+-transporting ATPase